MPVVEFVFFPASDAYIANKSIVRSPFDKVLRTAGCISVWQGIHEDGRTGQWAVVWESYEAHKALIDSPGYAELSREFAVAKASGNFHMQHIPYESDPLNILSAPVTEIAIMTLKPTVTKEQFIPVFTRFIQAIDKEEDSFPPSAFDESREIKGTLFATVGWQSRAAHEEVVEGERYRDIIAEINTMVDATVTHTALTRHLLQPKRQKKL